MGSGSTFNVWAPAQRSLNNFQAINVYCCTVVSEDHWPIYFLKRALQDFSGWMHAFTHLLFQCLILSRNLDGDSGCFLLQDTSISILFSWIKPSVCMETRDYVCRRRNDRCRARLTLGFYSSASAQFFVSDFADSGRTSIAKVTTWISHQV